MSQTKDSSNSQKPEEVRSVPDQDEETTIRLRKKEDDFQKKREFIRQEFYKPQRGVQEERIAKFFEAATDDIANFIRRTMGVNYEPKNNFSFTQKQKIMGYLYFKNNNDLTKTRMFTYLDVKAGDTKASIQNRIDHLKEMKDYNRCYFIYNLARCQNRLRTVGYIWGSVVAGVIWNTVMKQSSHIRKLAMTTFLIHVGGQLASYRNIDRVFDGMYPIFFKDFQEHLQAEARNKDKLITEETLQESDITRMMKQQVYEPQKVKKKLLENSMYNEDL